MFECGVVVIFVLYAALLDAYIGLPTLALTAVLLIIFLRAFRRSWLLTRIIIVLLVLVIGPPVLLTGASLINELLNTYTFRYRLTLEVETPEGLKSGSNVIQVSYTPHLIHWNLSASGLTTSVKGEAIYLDLGHGKNVIATLAFGPTGSDVNRIQRLPALVFDRYEGGFYKEAPSWEGRAELTGEFIPTLVTFADPADPMTLSVVAPDQFEAFFGPGYRFKGIWLEMTKDAVTEGLTKHLPWVGNYKLEVLADRRMREADKGKGPSRLIGAPFKRGR